MNSSATNTLLHVNPGNLGMTEKLKGKIQQNLFMVD